jgi:hypothetical protein
VTNEFEKILPKAVEFLRKLPVPTDGVEPCNSKRKRRSKLVDGTAQVFDKRDFLGGLFKTVFSLVSCVVDTTTKIKDEIIKGTKDTVESVVQLQDDLVPMLDALHEVDPGGSTKPSDAIGDTKPSEPNDDPKSSDPTTTSEVPSSSSSCTPQTISNCNIRCTAVVTTIVGGVRRRAEQDACTTSCARLITKCSTTGVSTRYFRKSSKSGS